MEGVPDGEMMGQVECIMGVLGDLCEHHGFTNVVSNLTQICVA